MSQNGYNFTPSRLRAEGDPRGFFVGVRGRSRAARLPVEPKMVTLRFGVVRRPRKRAKTAMDQKVQKCMKVATFLKTQLLRRNSRPSRTGIQFEPFMAHLRFRGLSLPPKTAPNAWAPRRNQRSAQTLLFTIIFRRRRNLRRKPRDPENGSHGHT